MSYATLMRNAAKILFVAAVAIFVGTIVFAALASGLRGPPAAFLAGIVSAVSSAVPAFAGAAILWRLDIWLFERSDRK